MAAVDTAVAPLKGAPMAGAKLEVYQRKINFADTGLASGDWFKLFTLEGGDVVLGGSVVVNGGTTGGDEDLTIGITGATTALLTATPVDTDATVAFTATTGVIVDDTTVNLYMTVDAADVGTVLVTMLVLKAGDTAG